MMREAFENLDIEIMKQLFHDDYRFISHASGTEITKSDMIGFAGSGGIKVENYRILFENDDVGVEHSIVHFANGSTSEAVLSFHRFKDGQVILTETGATPLSEDYKVFADS